MYKRVLLALDLEGVNHVVGESYQGLGKNTAQWEIAIEQAAKEINAATEALFDAGVEKVGVWDNHGGGGNLTAQMLDSRVELYYVDFSKPRMDFARGEYDCICYFGYHTMEGTLGGVLAHTMSSKIVQHYKLNGKHIGEVNMDAYIAASMGMPSLFFAGGDLSCKQASSAIKGIFTVQTKQEIGRNEAVFRDNEELLADIKYTIVCAVKSKSQPVELTFPATVEKSFKRTEDAAKYFHSLSSMGLNTEYLDDEILGKDAHTVQTRINSIDEFIKCI